MTTDMQTQSRADYLLAHDPQIRSAAPKPDVMAAARVPGLRLPEVLSTLVEGYADRPALGSRARTVITDEATGRTRTTLVPQFETITYGELWVDIQAVANAWHAAVKPGEFVVTIGFASADYLTVNLAACGYLGLVAVPLQHNAPVSRLQPILAETEPAVLAVSAAYLDLAVESVLGIGSLRRLVVFDVDEGDEDGQARLRGAEDKFAAAKMTVTVETLGDAIARGRTMTQVPWNTDGDADRLSMIFYTSGSTGAPKGAIWTEEMLCALWTRRTKASETPVLNVNFMPLNHLGGWLTLSAAFQAGGTSYFVPESDLSTLFEDWSLVRPTSLPMVPRVVDMLFQRFQYGVDRLVSQGTDPDEAAALANTEVREQVLGGRVLGGLVNTAPLSANMKTFIESCLQAHVVNTYGLTELGGVITDGAVLRPPVIDYKLIDVPELGYFHTDRPFPRGELLVKSATATPGYYKRPEVTAEAFTADGYYRTGDVVAETAPDRLVYVDRRKNVMKLSQGEFVAVSNLEAIFGEAAGVRQIFVYGNSERPVLLAVVVPTTETRERFADDAKSLKAAIRESLSQTARTAELQAYELPADLLIEDQPFTADNGLLSGVGKLLRPKLKEHYGAVLEQMYADLDTSRVDDLRALRAAAKDQPVVDSVVQAAKALLGTGGSAPRAEDHFLDLGGDSLSALTFSVLLRDVFDIEVPVGVIIAPTTTLAEIAGYVENERATGPSRPTAAGVHGAGAAQIRASELTLDKFLPAEILQKAGTLAPASTGSPQTVLLTGANGYLGRFLALDWLRRLSASGGTLICLVRGSDEAAAMARIEDVIDSGDSRLLSEFRRLAADHLEVLVGDLAEPEFGLDEAAWRRLTETVDVVVHAAALVNHVLPYTQLFGPNVVGTAEVIRLALTSRLKPVTYVSTVSVAATVEPGRFEEDGDIREISAVRPVDESYANGYGNSKWAGEVLLREAHDLCGLPASVFRSGMMLAHSEFTGQLNVPDMFTRLIFSVLVTGLAPGSFYQTDAAGHRRRAHYDGLPVDFVAEAITVLGAEANGGFHSYDVMNPHDDGVSLDVFVDWLIDAGHEINHVDDYDEWLNRFETALRALPEEQRQHSVLPLIQAYRHPAQPLPGSSAPTAEFQEAVQSAKIGADKDIPHLSRGLIGKYVADMRHFGMLEPQAQEAAASAR